MKRLIAAIGAAVMVFACGVSDQFEGGLDSSDTSERVELGRAKAISVSPDGSSDAPDIGQTKQAVISMTVPDGYGSDGNQNRCWAGLADGQHFQWGGGECNIPASKQLFLVNQSSTCTGSFAADYQAAWTAAANTTKTIAETLGWTVTISTWPTNATHAFSQVMACNSGASPDGAAARTSLIASGQIGGPTCVTNPSGQLCLYDHSNTILYRANVEAGQFLTTTSTQRRKLLQTVWQHEMFHAIGLGHDLCGPDPLADLMGAGGCQPAASNQWYVGTVRPYERSIISQYRP